MRNKYRVLYNNPSENFRYEINDKVVWAIPNKDNGCKKCVFGGIEYFKKHIINNHIQDAYKYLTIHGYRLFSIEWQDKIIDMEV